MSSDGLLDRLRERYRVATTPEHVERASPWERRKRGAWMLASSLLAIAIAAAPLYVLVWVGVTGEEFAFVVTGMYFIPAFVILDAYVIFPWGLNRFDIVVPWQFRDAAATKRTNLGALARDLEAIEEELHARGDADLRDCVASVRMNLVERGLQEAFDDDE